MKTLRSSAVTRPLLTALLVGTIVSFAQTPAPAPAMPAANETILLNPFDVTAGSTQGYMATNTISGTAMNTPLKEVPMTINVITAELLADMVPADLTAALTFNASITQTNRVATSSSTASPAVTTSRPK
jgi:outer membrane receptor for ferric coprogen and ferric-rhodotorulic acid